MTSSNIPETNAKTLHPGSVNAVKLVVPLDGKKGKVRSRRRFGEVKKTSTDSYVTYENLTKHTSTSFPSAAKFGIRSLSVALHLGWPHGHSREFPSSASTVLVPT